MKSSIHLSDRDSQGTVGSNMLIRKGAADLSATGSEEALNRSSGDVRLGPGPGPDPDQNLVQDPAPAPPSPAATAQPREQDPVASTPPLPKPAATSRSPSKPAIADETLSTASDLAAAAHQRQQQQQEQRQTRRSSRQPAGSSTRPCRSRGHRHHTTVQQPPPPTVPYVPYGYQDYRHSSAPTYDDDEYDDGWGPPPCSRRWRRIKRVLTLLSMAWAGVILSLACLFAAQGGMADSVGVWSIPIAIAALVWNSAELLVYAARARGVAPSGPTGRGAARAAVPGRAGVRRGIHPGAHVGLHLCLWLACALAIYLTMMVYQDVQNTMADCAAAAATPGSGGPEDHCQAAYHYTSNLHLFRQGFYSPSLRALLAMFGLATLTHFALFVRACVEVDRRNRARFAAADEEEYAASAAAVDDVRPAAAAAAAAAPVYGMVETGAPWTWVQPPDYYRSADGRRRSSPGAAGSHIVTLYDEDGGGPPLPGAALGAGGATKERV